MAQGVQLSGGGSSTQFGQMPGTLTLNWPFGNSTSNQPHSESQSTQNSVNQTYYSNPNLVQALAGNVGGVAQDAGNNYMNFLMNPTGSPLYTNALSGLLASLVPSENASRLALNDQFRAAGNTGSSTFGHAAAGLESDLARNRLGAASQLLTTLFPQMAQALYAPMSQTPSLIDALKLNTAASTGQSTSNSVGSVSNNLGNQSFTGFQSSPWALTSGGKPIV